MTIQEQAFVAYYASMTDAELFQVAVNKNSVIEVAQKTPMNSSNGPDNAVGGSTWSNCSCRTAASYVFKMLLRMLERALRALN